MVTQEQPYDVVQHLDGFELRRYPAHLVAEVRVSGSMAGAGNRAFRMLFGYISGKNTAQESIEMTSPVVQQDAAEKISMTAPVVQSTTSEGEHVVAFVLPESMSEKTAPVPIDPLVTIRTVPGSLAAAVGYTGRWSEANYQRHATALETAVAAAGYESVGAPRWARFDPPFKPWFLRRNEVVQDVSGPSTGRWSR